jgi:probable addiction module antidote protein
VAGTSPHKAPISKRRKIFGRITGNEKMKRDEDYKADLLNELRSDPDYAAEYLSAAKADSNEAFLVALRDVAEAQKGMKRVAKEASVNRENLYRALSREGNPRIDTLDSVLDVLDIGVKFVAKHSHTVSNVHDSDPAVALGQIIACDVEPASVDKTVSSTSSMRWVAGLATPSVGIISAFVETQLGGNAIRDVGGLPWAGVPQTQEHHTEESHP